MPVAALLHPPKESCSAPPRDRAFYPSCRIVLCTSRRHGYLSTSKTRSLVFVGHGIVRFHGPVRTPLPHNETCCYRNEANMGLVSNIVRRAVTSAP